MTDLTPLNRTPAATEDTPVIRHLLPEVSHFGAVGLLAYATIAGVSVAACLIA